MTLPTGTVTLIIPPDKELLVEKNLSPTAKASPTLPPVGKLSVVDIESAVSSIALTRESPKESIPGELKNITNRRVMLICFIGFLVSFFITAVHRSVSFFLAHN